MFAITGQSSGWMTCEKFREWVKVILLPYVQKKRLQLGKPDQKALLLVDGHSSRADSESLALLKENGVEVMLLVPHSSHLTQPLDLSLNFEFKTALHRRFHPLADWDKPTFRNELLLAATYALQATLICDVIQIGWRRAGIAPWDPKSVLGREGIVRGTLSARPLPRRKTLDIGGQVITSDNIMEKIQQRTEEKRKRKLEKEEKEKQKHSKKRQKVSKHGK